VFQAWQQRLATALHEGGLDACTADATATLLLAASDGAVVICRAQQDVKPFDTVAAELIQRVRDLQGFKIGTSEAPFKHNWSIPCEPCGSR
jgi:hypothetical protein